MRVFILLIICLIACNNKSKPESSHDSCVIYLKSHSNGALTGIQVLNVMDYDSLPDFYSKQEYCNLRYNKSNGAMYFRMDPCAISDYIINYRFKILNTDAFFEYQVLGKWKELGSEISMVIDTNVNNRIYLTVGLFGKVKPQMQLEDSLEQTSIYICGSGEAMLDTTIETW
jgi:hypothetical protein